MMYIIKFAFNSIKEFLLLLLRIELLSIKESYYYCCYHYCSFSHNFYRYNKHEDLSNKSSNESNRNKFQQYFKL